jgi:Zn finger protein HypA/HybF involved in hydrogenase expression
MITKTNLIRFPIKEYKLLCTKCGHLMSSLEVRLQISGYRCSKCDSQKLRRVFE